MRRDRGCVSCRRLQVWVSPDCVSILVHVCRMCMRVCMDTCVCISMFVSVSACAHVSAGVGVCTFSTS